jgi:capsular exopolysaccharide synthesis family protein
MSRIQDILKKAERDGGVHRTRPLTSPEPAAWARPEPAKWVEDAPSVGQAVAERPRVEPPPRPAMPPLPAPDTPRHPELGLDPLLVAAHAPQSLAAEQYRALRTRVKSAERGRPIRTILITSPNKGDGKTLTAANLALTMAQEFQHRVLLIDADLRRPTVHRLFGIADTPGLSDVLMGGAALDDALVAVPDHRLTLLPSGMIPMHPAELLGSAAMRQVLDTLRARYDRILIDMPPVAPLADVAIASAMVDGVLMIVRAGVTPKPAIERALSGLDVSKVLGLVLNDGGDAGAGYGYGAGYVAG